MILSKQQADSERLVVIKAETQTLCDLFNTRLIRRVDKHVYLTIPCNVYLVESINQLLQLIKEMGYELRDRANNRIEMSFIFTT